GLERMSAAMQHVISNYDTDLLKPIVHKAGDLFGRSLGDDARTDTVLRINADHARATAFLIHDGVLPSNEGRGYVLRKIMRRGMRHAQLLGPEQPFFTDMIVAVRDLMGGAYPELLGEAGAHVLKVVSEEEKRFHHTIEVGLEHLQNGLQNLQDNIDRVEREYTQALRIARDPGAYGDVSAADFETHKMSVETGRTLDGREAFRLYDTYGLPKDFIEDVARDSGFEVDWKAFDRAMEEQRTRAKASWKGTSKALANPAYAQLAETFRTEPDFYFGAATSDCRIEAIITKEGSVNEIRKGQEAEVVLDRTSIYAESGGQVADVGGFYDDSETLHLAEVRGAYYPVAGLVAHRILAKEDLQVGDRIATVADADRRAHNMRNHTATHLMHAALRNILGTHVKQAGSLVAPDHLRFDFSHFAAVDSSELADVEQQVNEEILKNLELRTDITNIDDALASGALAFFGDKYPESNVRVVTVADPESPRGFYSKELCGGTHVGRTGSIGIFKIVAEQSVAAGVRRIEAISGDRALADYQRALGILRSAAGLLNSSEDGVLEAIERQLETTKQLEKQLNALKRKSAGSLADDLIENAREVKGVRVLAAQVPGYDRAALRQLVDALRQKLGSGVIVLASAEDGKVALITGVTKDLTSKVHAGKIVQELAKVVGGSGGGKPDLAEAGGKDTSAIEKALGNVYPLLDQLL
ncbi:MAG: alanine--tRNA ligase-related protein, partial [Candidatus Acidiferrales bacterium]